jgi:pimeloyl-ACP methyl ester carboxylesterase
MAIQNVNGHDMFYDEAGSGDILVMIYGSVDGSARIFTPHLAELSKDFRVILPDLRGLGRSAHVNDMEPSAWVDDLGGLLDALGVQSAHIYGGAMGSRPALRFALDHPDRIKSLIVDWVVLANDDESDKQSIGNFGASVPPDRAANLKEHHGDDWAEVSDFYLRLRTGDAFKEYYDLRESSKGITVPTLILRGDTDANPEIHPLSHSILAHQNIANSWLKIYPNFRGNIARLLPMEFRALFREFVASLS